MAWGTIFNTDVFISRESFLTQQEVKDRIEDLYKSIDESKSYIKILAAATPRDIIPPDWQEDPTMWINNQIEGSVGMIREDIHLLTKLQLFIEYLEENNLQPKDLKDGDD